MVGDDDKLPSYPISAAHRLDSHFFLQFNLRRWELSSFQTHAHKDPEVGFYGLQLFFKAHGGAPIGTLPDCDDDLAFMLHLTVDKWKSLRARPISPLYNWSSVQCDNGEIRLAHPVVTEVMQQALRSKRMNATKKADDLLRKRHKTIGTNLRKLPGGDVYADCEDRVGQVSDWIEDYYPGGSATIRRVKEAINALSA